MKNNILIKSKVPIIKVNSVTNFINMNSKFPKIEFTTKNPKFYSNGKTIIINMRQRKI